MLNISMPDTPAITLVRSYYAQNKRKCAVRLHNPSEDRNVPPTYFFGHATADI